MAKKAKESLIYRPSINDYRRYLQDYYLRSYKDNGDYEQYDKPRTIYNRINKIILWFNDYMLSTARLQKGHSSYFPYINIPARETPHNPLFNIWKVRGAEDSDIVSFFYILDILHSAGTALTVSEIMDRMAEYCHEEDEANILLKLAYTDSSDFSKTRLMPLVSSGILIYEKKRHRYRKASIEDLPGSREMLDFFSEVTPCGVIGSFILDKLQTDESGMIFRFKHNFLVNALDSEITNDLFSAIREKCNVKIRYLNVRKHSYKDHLVTPLKILSSVQNGRQHLACYDEHSKSFRTYRIDYIESVKIEGACTEYDSIKKSWAHIEAHTWGVSVWDIHRKMEHVEFTIRYRNNEYYIPKRLEREKRCGNVEYLNDNRCKFQADVYDSIELLPWIRTFICRIESISFSNDEVSARFENDLNRMYEMYGIRERVNNDI